MDRLTSDSSENEGGLLLSTGASVAFKRPNGVEWTIRKTRRMSHPWFRCCTYTYIVPSVCTELGVVAGKRDSSTFKSGTGVAGSRERIDTSKTTNSRG